jgi:serine protease Do
MRKLLVFVFVVLCALGPADNPAFARVMETGDATVVRRATAAVVNISTWKVRAAPNPGESPRRVKVYASGFVIDPSGIIVTNKHVIDGAIDLVAIFNDGDEAPARLIAAAAMLDLAVLKVDRNHPLPYLKWANSDALQVGDPVLTIGDPLGLGLSVSAGIVSALNRDLEDSPFDSYIQTDAAINHGNSGGPLVNQAGDVVGIDTALYNPEEAGGFIGIGFAIPSNSAAFVTNLLLDPTHPKPGWLGFTLQDMTRELAKALALPQHSGAIISAVEELGPATDAGLRVGDVLDTLNGVHLDDSRAFMRAIVQIKVGEPARLTIWRDGKQREVTATVGEWPNYLSASGVMSQVAAQAMISKEPDPGIRVAPITPAARAEYKLDPNLSGALVSSVEADCEARDLGIVAGDVIIAVQGRPVTSPDDVRGAVREAHEQHRPYLALLVQSKNGPRWYALSVSNAGT